MTVLQVDHMPRRKRGRPRKVKKQDDEGLAKIKRIVLLGGGGDAPTKSKGYVRKRAVMEDFYVSAEAMNAVMSKAQEIKAKLAKDHHPTVARTMLPSNVSNGFWMGLSKEFCDDHMSIVDRKVELEDESGRVWPAKYLAVKQGLSGGWRGFSIAQKLVEGDVVVFQLVRPNKFKVYIVRSNASNEADVDLGVPSSAGQKCWQEERTYQDLELLQPLGTQPELVEEARSSMLSDDNDDDDDEEEEDDESEDGGSNGNQFQRTKTVDFKQVTDFDYFGIVANGSIINHELSKQLGFKYYELCRSQDSFLHQNLLKGLNNKLVAGMIAETVCIADAIRAAHLVAGHEEEEFESWERRLKAFEKLGMNVGFLLARLRQLRCLCGKANRYKRLKAERSDVEERVRVLEGQLGEAKGRMKELEVEIEGLGIGGDGVEVAFRELANAPW